MGKPRKLKREHAPVMTRLLKELAAANRDHPSAMTSACAKVTEFELIQHSRDGHQVFMHECAECRVGAVRQRPHRRQPAHLRPGGEFSVDLSGPRVAARFPSDAPEAWPRRAQYFVIGT